MKREALEAGIIADHQQSASVGGGSTAALHIPSAWANLYLLPLSFPA